MQTWQLKSNNGESFNLTFDAFNVQYGQSGNNGDGFPDCIDEFVYISGGTSSSPQPLDKKHCNHEWYIPGPIPGPFTGTDMTVSFKSNTAFARTGFLAVVTGVVTVTTVTGEL